MHDEWGITDGYFDVAGQWHPTTDETRDLLRQAMGEPQQSPPLWFVTPGETHELWNTCALSLEDGTVVGDINALPNDLPLGYHDLAPVDGGPITRLIVHPTACQPLPQGWGVSAQLYALWSSSSWGIGDLSDLHTLAVRCVKEGAAFILTSPLHQPAPSSPQEASPYYPSSRRSWNPLLLAVASEPPPELQCSAEALIKRDVVWPAKRAQLETLFLADENTQFQPADAAAEPPASDLVSIWNALSDRFGPDWREWPSDLQQPGSSVLRAMPADPEFARAVAFHQWCQRQIASQLQHVRSTGIGLIGDLAVGFSPNGADAWQFQAQLALDARIGAPPDPFSADGQEWGIPPFVPWRLRQVWYEPFIETVRACMRGVAGIRIDHILGLFRQFWVPAGRSPREGAYVQFPAHELLAILCLEAVRAGVFVIGEDLGTVEPYVRQDLAARNIACTKVVWFEPEPPSSWPEMCLATVTTHDLPTIAGVFATAGELRQRLGALSSATTVAQLINDAHEALLRSPPRLRLISLDDVCASSEQPNHPGSQSEANWCRRLPVAVIDLPGFRGESFD